jgi:hypothetical protein
MRPVETILGIGGKGDKREGRGGGEPSYDIL